MRSLFHFPLPAQPPSQQPSHCSQKCAIARILHPCAASAAPQFCFPPPARSPVPRLPDPGPLSPAPRAPAIPRRRPCLTPLPALIAPHHLSTAPLPPAPIGLASSASRPPHAVARIASTPLRAAIRIPLCRHRADSALIAPITTIVRRRRLTRVALRRPHRAHRAPPPASPPSLSSRCGGPRALAGKNRTVCIPFSPNARKRPPSWQHPPEMHAFRDQNGNILAPCIHSRVQSGDSGYMARESCRQGPFFASRSPKSRMARRCCQRRPAFLRQRPAVRPNGLCAMRRGPGLLAACAPPCHLACVRRGLRPPAISPAFIAAVLHACASPPVSRPPRAAIRRAAHCGRDELSIGLFLPPSCCPRRCISPPARRTHPASRADPPRPGNKRNNANNSMRT